MLDQAAQPLYFQSEWWSLSCEQRVHFRDIRMSWRAKSTPAHAAEQMEFYKLVWVCGRNSTVWPVEWNLFASTFNMVLYVFQHFTKWSLEFCQVLTKSAFKSERLNVSCLATWWRCFGTSKYSSGTSKNRFNRKNRERQQFFTCTTLFGTFLWHCTTTIEIV